MNDNEIFLESSDCTDIEILTEYFEKEDEGKKPTILFKYFESDFKGEDLLIALSNLDVRCDLLFSPDMTYEEKSELMLAYLITDALVSLPSLVFTTMFILFQYKEIPWTHLSSQVMMTEEDIEKFIEENKEVVKNAVCFMDSMVPYSIQTVQEEKMQELSSMLRVIDDRNAVGDNLVHLLSLSVFFLFYSVKAEEYVCFKQQWTEPIYKGDNLFKYYFNKENPLALTLYAIQEDELDVNQLLDASLEADKENDGPDSQADGEV